MFEPKNQLANQSVFGGRDGLPVISNDKHFEEVFWRTFTFLQVTNWSWKSPNSSPNSHAIHGMDRSLVLSTNAPIQAKNASPKPYTQKPDYFSEGARNLLSTKIRQLENCIKFKFSSKDNQFLKSLRFREGWTYLSVSFIVEEDVFKL